MGFIITYTLFLLKALTIVIALLLTILGIVIIGRKGRPRLEITSLNKQYDTTKHLMSHVVKNKKIKSSKKNKKLLNSLFLLDFQGDIKASNVDELSEAITAILCIANEHDEVVIRLESPGGSVNGYGLAAAQLQRIRNRNIPLTVCIDKVAASGGYLIACVANKILAAPFAIVGSIGVVAQLPNFHRLLKKNDIDIEMLTAGEYKRTLTMFAENTDKGRQKCQEDIEKIHAAFRNYVLTNRPQVDIDQVATGEYWLAKDALQLQLVDNLQTSDDYIMGKLENFKAFKINIHAKKPFTQKIFKPFMLVLHHLLNKFEIPFVNLLPERQTRY